MATLHCYMCVVNGVLKTIDGLGGSGEVYYSNASSYVVLLGKLSVFVILRTSHYIITAP